MLAFLQSIFSRLKCTIFHPQWLSHRFHKKFHSRLSSLHGKLILDIGSGNSNYNNILDKSNTLIQLDYPTTNTRYTQEPNIYADATSLPFDSNTIDIALYFEVMEHIANDRATLNEIFRILKPNGRLYISTPFVYPMHDQPYDYHRYTIYGLKNALENAGFRIQEIHAAGNSIVTSFLLFNLSLLEFCKFVEQRSKLLVFLLLFIVSLFCFLSNCIALLFIPANFLNASCIGYFSIANKHISKK